MAGPSLDDAWDKLRWARKHFEALRAEIEPFEKRDTHTITFECNPDTGEYVFHVHGLEAPDPDWGLQIGDCLHNARTALDYLIVRLYALVTGSPLREIDTIQFPIYDKPERFAGAVGKLRQEPALSGYLTRIEELQPFNTGNVSVWGLDEHRAWPHISPLPSALSRLSLLDNLDKHRVFHAAWLGTNVFRSEGLHPPSTFALLGATTVFGPLEENAQICRMRFQAPLPHEWHPDQVTMKRAFPIEVAFDEPLPVKGVLEVVPFCLWGVETVLTLFDPVFSHGAPPLPVTAAERWDDIY